LYRSIALEGGEEKPVELPTHVQITNISFGENLADKTGRTVVKLTYSLPHTSDDDDEDEDEDEGALSRITTVLCALTPGKVILMFYCRMRCISFYSNRLSSLL
jgi:hypothetical protein